MKKHCSAYIPVQSVIQHVFIVIIQSRLQPVLLDILSVYIEKKQVNNSTKLNVFL